MLRLEPNLSLLLQELPLLERPGAAAALGFERAELWWPFDSPNPAHSETEPLIMAFQDAGIRLACLNFYGGDFAAGERGLMSIPSEDHRFKANLIPAVTLANRLGCRTMNALYGNTVSELSSREQVEVATENLRLAVREADQIGARVVVEALNPVEYPNYALHNVDDVIDFLDAAFQVAHATAWCNFDVYHAVRAGSAPVDLHCPLRRPDRTRAVRGCTWSTRTRNRPHRLP